MSTPIRMVVDYALAQTGDRYVLGAEVPTYAHDSDIWDCSELVEISCRESGVRPTMPDGAHWQLSHCQKYNTTIPVATAYTVYGALLFIDKGAAGGGGQGNHVAISLGNGMTIEARGKAYGVGSWAAPGRSWTHAATIPGCDYSALIPPLPPEDNVSQSFVLHPNPDSPTIPGRLRYYTFDMPNQNIIGWNGAVIDHPGAFVFGSGNEQLSILSITEAYHPNKPGFAIGSWNNPADDRRYVVIACEDGGDLAVPML